MTRHYLTIHGHFYQPPREDPRTGRIQREPDAAPFHDFNEKILAECYRPNAELGNFDWMSFDIGPTLGEWMRRDHPDVLRRIAAADRDAVARTGVGNAIMQSFHHTILPLASERDRRTELHWGVRWFEHTFGRRPVGIWLPETAVDYPTLEACADEGLRFTILSPDQAASPVDTRFPYTVHLPSGRSFIACFYEGPLSGTVSFDPSATVFGRDFLERHVLPRLTIDGPLAGGETPLVLIASDGEVYGHHHRFKDLFLKDLLQTEAPAFGIQPVSLEQYLAAVPATREVTIRERSSWGCAHDLLRWRGDCPCTPGDGTWKAGLRRAFDRLATRLDAFTDAYAERYRIDIWALRDAYVDAVIGAQPAAEWMAAHGLPSTGPDAQDLLMLLEAQRYRLAMYTSCGFYWEDLSRIEAVYGIRSALYAVELAERLGARDLKAAFDADIAALHGGDVARIPEARVS